MHSEIYLDIVSFNDLSQEISKGPGSSEWIHVSAATGGTLLRIAAKEVNQIHSRQSLTCRNSSELRSDGSMSFSSS